MPLTRERTHGLRRARHPIVGQHHHDDANGSCSDHQRHERHYDGPLFTCNTKIGTDADGPASGDIVRRPDLRFGQFDAAVQATPLPAMASPPASSLWQTSLGAHLHLQSTRSALFSSSSMEAGETMRVDLWRFRAGSSLSPVTRKSAALASASASR